MALVRLPAVADMSIVQVATTVVALLLGSFVVKLVRHRLAWRAHHLPGPPHSFLWGHLVELHKGIKADGLPPDAAFDYVARRLSRTYGSVVYLDLWPVTPSMCLVGRGSTADKILRVDDLPKFLELYKTVVPVIGKESMLLAGVGHCFDWTWQSSQ